MIDVLNRTGHKDVASKVSAILQASKVQVRTAQKRSGEVEHLPLSKNECNSQLLYLALNEFELLLESAVGAFQYQDQTIAFGQGPKKTHKFPTGSEIAHEVWDLKWGTIIRNHKNQFQIIAPARHWYFHHTGDDMDISKVLQAMREILATTQMEGGEWKPPVLVTRNTVQVAVTLEETPGRMSIPIDRDRSIVGRETVIADTATKLMAGTHARVLLHGIAGVGKDTVAAEVVNEQGVQELGGLQAWLQASHDTILQQQLVDLFMTHRPWVLDEKENDIPGSLAAIKSWLADHSDWLLVFEDASLNSATMWDILPRGMGRVLVTSQALLHATHAEFESIEIGEISTADSINLLLFGKIFSKMATRSDSPPLEDCALIDMCKSARVTYLEPVPKEKLTDSIKRRRNMTEMLRPEFATFLEQELGNLPLSVSMVGQMIRSDATITSTLELIQVFKNVQLDQVWATKARNNQTDKHYFGLATSVKITLDRMESNTDFSSKECRDAKSLLVAMSMLDRTKTPLALLQSHDAVDADDENKNDHLIFENASFLNRAREILYSVGVLRKGAESDLHVGVIHQLVQKCLRQSLTVRPESAKTLKIIRERLIARFDFDLKLPNTWACLRLLLSSVQAWCDAVLVGAYSDGTSPLKPTTVEITLLENMGGVLQICNGNARGARLVFEEAQSLAERLLPENHPRVVTSMTNLANSLCAEGRHVEALVLQEKVSFSSFPQNHSPSSHRFVLLD
jgi:hypothetical protein